MKSKEQAKAEYAHRSEVLTHGLRRDVWVSIQIALQNNGQISLAKDIGEFLLSQEASN